MKALMDCNIYYSMIGERFNIFERNTDPNIWLTKARINIHANEPALADDMDDYLQEEAEDEASVSLEIPDEVEGGPFFASDTQCIIVNGKNQILKLGGDYRFDVKMFRSLDNPSRFTMLFRNKEIKARPVWVSF